MNKKRLHILVTGLVLTTLALVTTPTLVGVANQAEAEVNYSQLNTDFFYETLPYYEQKLKEWKDATISSGNDSIVISAGDFISRSDQQLFKIDSYEGKQDVLVWKTDTTSWLEYEVTVTTAGLYELHASYYPIKENELKQPIRWAVTIDSEEQYRESSSTALYRDWRDSTPILTNKDGDQIRPKSIDISDWKSAPLKDASGATAKPLQWYFSEGKHVIRLEGYDSVALEYLKLTPAQEVASYTDVLKQYERADKAEGEVITLQAEQFNHKNDTAIKLFSDKNARTVPRYTGRTLFNTIGGLRWIEQNQEITWSFEVPESGLYHIAFRALQNTIAQKSSFRVVRIDGEIPFQELAHYRIPYDTSWQGIVLKDKEEPYSFYLEKGSHTLSLAVTHEPVKSILIDLERLIAHLDAIEWTLRTVSGTSSVYTLDRNRTWNMDVDFPGMLEQIRLAAEVMEDLSARLIATNGSKDSISQGLITSKNDLQSLLKKPEEIPYHIDEINSMRDKFSTFIDTLMKQSLQLDEIYIVPAATQLPNMTAGVLQSAWGSVENFVYSFDSRDSLNDLDDSKLNVWVYRGRDYVDQIQQQVDESFTAEYGIEVKINLLPNPELLLMSNAAGVQPDVALGLTQDLPVDYAMRGMVENLAELDGFDQLYEQYSAGSWLPLHYDNGYYGVPETQSFQVLYYRKDIFERLGVGIPDTWDDVYELLPTLQQNFMNFYINPKEYSFYFYQNGVELYEPGGLKSGLDSPEAYTAFKQWTDLFNTYALETEVPSFYQHFRSGTMPIGISDYNMYVQLSAAAPELNGKWGIALIPGTKQADGTITRWAGGGQRTGVILKGSNKKDEAWQFLQWWLSTDTQEQFGSDLEAMNGVAFRWNTSNIEAFTRLPWKKEDAEVILNQWKWYKDIPNTPGGYFLDREINNAWIRTVIGTTNYRASLEQAVQDINRELLRKQQEFGLVDSSGEVMKSLTIPIVDKPWEGVDQYVN